MLIDDPARMGREVDRLMKARKMTQRELARRSGVSWQTIRRWRLGYGSPSLAAAVSILAALGQGLKIEQTVPAEYARLDE